MDALNLPSSKRRETIAQSPNGKQVRRSERAPVPCQLYYAGIGIQGQGTLSDLSIDGCRVQGTIPVKKGTKLTIIILYPETSHPIIIDKARVEWSKGRRFALSYEVVYPSERRNVLELLQVVGRSKVSH
jgi:PilZ domain-containing protein